MAHHYKTLITVGNGNIGFSFPQKMVKETDIVVGEEIALIFDENNPEEIKILRKSKLEEFKKKLSEIDAEALSE